MKKLVFFSFALILVIGLVLGGCGGTTITSTVPTTVTKTTGTTSTSTTTATTTATSTTTATAPITEIRIGAIGSLTGMNAMTGAEHVWAYNQAVADINAAGGVMVKSLGVKLPIRLIFEDDRSENDQGAAVMERLVKLEGVSIVLGTNITPINEAAGTVAEKYKVYLQINTSWLDFWDAQDFKWSTDMFTTTTDAAETPFKIWTAQPAADRPQHPVVLSEDNPDGQGFASGFVAAAPKYGFTLAANEAYTPGTKDFSSVILKFKQLNADALLWLGSPTDSITLIRQMKEQQFAPKYVHGWKGFWPTEFYTGLGADSNYLLHDGFWYEGLPNPGAADLGQKFRDAHGGLDSVSVGIEYANVQILAQAIERAGTLDAAAVRDVVFNSGFFPGTVMGDIQYNDQGLAFKPLLALQWWNGTRNEVYPDLAAGYALKWMPPWNQR